MISALRVCYDTRRGSNKDHNFRKSSPTAGRIHKRLTLLQVPSVRSKDNSIEAQRVRSDAFGEKREAEMVMMAVRAVAVVLLLALSQAAIAQTQEATAQSDQLLKPEQLDALVAPIALYPDTLLAEILMAS